MTYLVVDIILYLTRPFTWIIAGNYVPVSFNVLLAVFGSLYRISRAAISVRRFTLRPFHPLKVIVSYHIKGLLVVADKLHLLPALLTFENVICLIQYRTKVFYKLLKPCLDLTAGLHHLVGKAFALLILTVLSGIYRFSKIKRSKSNYIFYKFGLV